MGYIYIYFTKDKICKYVGQSIDWKRRFYQHSKTDMKDKIKEIDSIVVYQCGNDKMNKLESYLINRLFPEWNNKIPKESEHIDLTYYKKFYVPIRHMKRG